jgi:hypothetical protein
MILKATPTIDPISPSQLVRLGCLICFEKLLASPHFTYRLSRALFYSF